MIRARWWAAVLLQPLAAAAFTPDLSDLDRVPLALERAPLEKQIELAAEKTQPLQFAVTAPLAAGLQDGAWDVVDGLRRWRLRVASPGAQTLSFELAQFHLPAHAELWIYDAAGAVAQGPYSAADHTPEGKLWTALVPGDQAVLELRVPATERDAVALELAAIGHGFRGFGKDGDVAEKSGSCNVDAVCPQGNDWRNQIRSVARVSIGNKFLCSGQMLNDTRQDGDPLFITANHCGIGQNLCGVTGVQACSPSSVVLYWNYFNSTCRSSTGTADRSGNGSLSQSQSGSAVLAADIGADFTLLRLNQRPKASFNVYYTGWNATNNVPQSGIAIHHPEGDEKSLAIYDAPARRADTCIDGTQSSCRRDVHAWGVHWTQGTTEQGSSGGGLWDQNQLLVGWLSGGQASCDEPDGEDFFGRMEVAWQAGPQSDQQLQPWLAPDDAEAKSVCGKNQSGGACDNATAPAMAGDSGGGGGSLGWLTLLPLLLGSRLRAQRR